MKQLLITLAMLIVTASSAKAEDTDSLYTPSMLSIGTMVPDIVIDSIHNISLSRETISHSTTTDNPNLYNIL